MSTSYVCIISAINFLCSLYLYISDFLASRGKPTDFWTDSKEELAMKLREFYCCVRKVPNKDGVAEEYGKASFLNMRAGLQRFLVSPPHNRVIDIRKDIEFQGLIRLCKAN